MEFKNLHNVLKTANDNLINNIIEDLNAGNNNGSGRLGSSLSTTITGTSEVISVGLFGLDYWKYFDKGRKPGKMPPVDPIQRWIDNKGLSLNAWAVAKSIAKKGTKGTNIFTDNIAEYEKGIDLFNAMFMDLDSELDKIINEFNKG